MFDLCRFVLGRFVSILDIMFVVVCCCLGCAVYCLLFIWLISRDVIGGWRWFRMILIWFIRIGDIIVLVCFD